ncbi:MAG: YceH family protein [Candidatus Firestonebacteria bacterium]|nr:YceH family protein [Candidatus Firestonebacteria bacterium]
MDYILTPIEIRILGSLIEKELATPDYYPLTLNSLTAACNQKSSRDPVMNIDEQIVIRVLEDLRLKQLVWQTTSMEGRVPKYKHNMKIFNFSPAETAILCVLFLRGPKTAGELRIHTERLYKFNSIEEVENNLNKLLEIEKGPYIIHLPRESGHRERRYAHLFCGEVKVNLSQQEESQALEVKYENQKIENLETEVNRIKKELKDFKEQFEIFKKQFE